MKEIGKKAVLLLSIIVCITGCGKEANSAKISSDTGDEYVYQSETYALDELNGYAMGLTSQKDDLYISMFSYDVETNSSESYISQYNIEKKTMRKVTPELEGGQSIQQFRVNENGTYTVGVYTREGLNLTGFLINIYDEQGKLIKENDVTETVMADMDAGVLIDCAQIDSQGNIYLSHSNNNNTDFRSSLIRGISPEGKILFRVEVSGNVNGIALMGDERLFVACQSEEGNMSIMELDIPTSKTTYILKDLEENEYQTNILIAREQDKLYFDASNEMYEYDFETKQNTKLFSLTDMNISNQNICGMVQLDKNTFCTLVNEYDEEKDITTNQVVCIKRVKAEEGKETVSDKKVLTIAVLMEDDFVKEEIVKFNKKCDTHKIKLKVYGDTLEEDAINLLQADIAAGNIPDIIDVGSVDAGNYIRKGILTDLDPFMQADEELSRDKFIEKALDTYSDGEKLYAIPTQFWLGSLVGKTANLNGMTSWNLEEYKAFVSSLPNSKAATNGASKEQMFARLMEQYAGTFIDWSEGSCSFESEEFISLLEFINTFPKEEMYNETSKLEMIRSNELLLYPTVMNSVMSFQMNQALFNESVSYIGFPTESSGGTKMMILGNAFGITEACEDKEIAWEFLKGLCTDEDVYLSGFPVYKESLENAFEFAMVTFYTTDANGNRIEDVQFEIPYGEEVLEIYAAKQEQIEQLRNLIDSAEGADMRTPGVYAILEEEAGAYFNGQKSVNEVVAIIQSRIMIYISENLK